MKVMHKKKIIIFSLIVAFVIIFWSSSLLQGYFKEGTDFLESYGKIHPSLSILVFVGLTALSAMLMSFSSIWLVPVAVVLWSNNLTVLLLLLSWLLGAVVSYLIGYYGGYKIVRKLIPEKKISYYQNLITTRLGFWVILLFRFTLPSEIPGYILGIARYPFWKYLFITFIAELPYAIYSVYAFKSIIDKDKTMFLITAVVWFLTAWLLAYLYMKKIKNQN